MDVWLNLQVFFLALISFVWWVAAPLSLGFLILRYPEYISDTHIEIMGWVFFSFAGRGLWVWKEAIWGVED